MSDPRHNEKILTDEEVAEMYSPSPTFLKAWWPIVPHYYGDAVRQLMLGASALMLIASPLYGTNLRIEFPFVIVGAIVAASFAALANPRDSWIAVANTVVAGAGLVIYAAWGIFEYDTISTVAFVLRLTIAVVFLFAFYFSMKTVRAFMSHQIGKRETVDEFDEEFEKAEQARLERENR